VKTDIHPEYVETTVHCSCGNEFTTRSTREKLTAELCNECHPFYTGRQKLVDSGGRVERFRKRTEKTDASAVEAKKAKRATSAKIKESTAKPTSAAKAGVSKPIRTRRTPKEQAAEAAKAERLAKAKADAEKTAAMPAESVAPADPTE
jgi:large subunit ribosomal protein L31